MYASKNLANFTFTISNVLLFIPFLVFAGDECGQAPKKSSLNEAMRATRQTQQKACKESEFESKLTSLAKTCDGADGNGQVANGADALKANLKKFCDSAGEAIDSAKNACEQNKAAEREAEAAKAKVAELRGTPEFADGVLGAIQENKDKIKGQLQKASKDAEIAALKADDKKHPAEIATAEKDALKKIEALKAERAGRRTSAEREWGACKSKACDTAAKSKFQEASKQINAGEKDCGALKKTQAELLKLQKILEKDLAKLAKADRDLAFEANTVAGNVDKMMADDKKYLAEFSKLGGPKEKTPVAPASLVSDPSKANINEKFDQMISEYKDARATKGIKSSEQLTELEKEERARKFAEVMEPFVNEFLEQKVKRDIPLRSEKIEALKKDLVGQMLYETDFCTNNGCLDKNNFMGLGGMKGAYKDPQEFFSKPGNPMSMRPSTEGYAGLAGYTTPGSNWGAYGNAGNHIANGCADCYSRAVAYGGFSSAASGGTYYSSIQTRRRQAYETNVLATSAKSALPGTSGSSLSPEFVNQSEIAKLQRNISSITQDTTPTDEAKITSGLWINRLIDFSQFEPSK